jgi:hypothetical protein
VPLVLAVHIVALLALMRMSSPALTVPKFTLPGVVA